MNATRIRRVAATAALTAALATGVLACGTDKAPDHPLSATAASGLTASANSASSPSGANEVTAKAAPAGEHQPGEPVTDSFNRLTLVLSPGVGEPTAQQRQICTQRYSTGEDLNARVDVAMTATGTSQYSQVPPFYSQQLRTADGREVTATCIIVDGDGKQGIAPGTTKHVAYFFTLPTGAQAGGVDIGGMKFSLG